MRKSEYYGIDVPELGDRADITVVSQAIIDSENNQSGKVENMKATLNSTIIELTSECRTNKLLKYYNGLSIQFVSPVDINAGNSYNIKIDNLAEQPYNNKIDIKLGDVVVAVYGESGFVSYGTTLPRSSSVESDSEVSIATSKSVKTAYDKGVEALDKANTKLDKGSEDLKLSNAELIVKAIESNQGLKFDTILNIDDVGAKQEGYCYMFEGDIYKCLKQTDGVTPESANFQPISNNKLSDRLDNLQEQEWTNIISPHQCLSSNSSLRRTGNTGIVFLGLNINTPITYEPIVIGKLAYNNHDAVEYAIDTLNIRIENGDIKLRCSNNSANFGWVAILTLPILLKL